MDAVKKRTLALSMPMLTENLRLKDLYPHLAQIDNFGNVLDKIRRIEINDGTRDAIQFFVTELQRFSNETYIAFILAVDKIGQKDIVQCIEQFRYKAEQEELAKSSSMPSLTLPANGGSMDPAHLALLIEHRNVLVSDMDTVRVVDYLISRSIIEELHENEIMSKPTSGDRNRELIKILKTRGAAAFGEFVKALDATQQYKLATLLKK